MIPVEVYLLLAAMLSLAVIALSVLVMAPWQFILGMMKGQDIHWPFFRPFLFGGAAGGAIAPVCVLLAGAWPEPGEEFDSDWWIGILVLGVSAGLIGFSAGAALLACVRWGTRRLVNAINARRIPTLVGQLQAPDSRVRRRAVVHLGWLGTKAASAVPPLAAALQDSSSDVRYEAVLALQWLGPAAGVAIPALREALQDPEGRVRISAAMTA